MARRRSYVSAFAQMQREAARAQTAQVRAQAAARREAERAQAAYLRASAADQKERKRLYAESRAAEVAAKNDDLEAETAALQVILAVALKAYDQNQLFLVEEACCRSSMDRRATREARASPNAGCIPAGGADRLVESIRQEQVRAGF